MMRSAAFVQLCRSTQARRLYLASDQIRHNRVLREITVSGLLLLLGYTGLFCLLQAPVLWYPLRPDPARSLFPEFFQPINALFPDRWVNLDRTDPFALWVVPLYLAVLVFVTVPLVVLLKRVAQARALNVSHSAPVLRRVLGFTAAIMLVLLFVRGLLSTDIYSYIWYARIAVVHDASPFTHAPSEFPPDPEGAIHWAGWQDETSVYGPAWLYLSSGVFKVGEQLGGSFSTQIILFRLLANAAHLLNAWLVWVIVGGYLQRQRARRSGSLTVRRRLRAAPIGIRRLRKRTRHGSCVRATATAGLQTAALLFYVWNPLLLIEFAGTGHNDVVMLTFVLLAVWAHLKGWWPAAALALGLAVLIKLPAIIFLPGYLWLLTWEGFRAARYRSVIRKFGHGALRAGAALGVMAAVGILLYAPVWEGLSTLLALVSGPANRLFLHSFASDLWWNGPDLLIKAVGMSAGQEEFREAAWSLIDRTLRLLLIGLFGAVAVAVTWRARRLRRTVTAWGWVAVAAVLTQGWFWPWYVSWAVVPAALSPSRLLRNATLIFSLSALLLYVHQQVLKHHFRLFVDWSGVFFMGPPLIYLAGVVVVHFIRNRRKRLLTSRGVNSQRTLGANDPEPAY